MKQGMCIMSSASLKFPCCSVFVPRLHDCLMVYLVAEFSKAVILICNTCFSMCMAWFCIWDASSSFFETLDARLIVIVADGL